MTAEQAVRLVEITRNKATELFDELITELRRDRDLSEGRGGGSPGETQVAAATSDRPRGYDEVWSLDEKSLNGDWQEVERRQGETYGWPDKSVDSYSDFVVYRGSGDFTGMTFGIGDDTRGTKVGFVMGGGGGSKRALAVFFPADDINQTNEMVSMIRGGGPTGRSGFRPGEALPGAYANFQTDVLRDRVAGKWNVQAVVAKEDDFKTMLGHTALQVKLRGISY